MNTNMIHNILNIVGLIVGALMTYDWTLLGLDASTAAWVAGVFIFGDKVIKLVMNIFRDGVGGLFTAQPPVVK